jgi:3-oxoacyl-[acyl-carrier protein] reductase
MIIDFTGKIAIVTGADGGIGQEIAETLLKLNAIVIITGIGSAPKWTEKYSECIFYRLNYLEDNSFSEFSNSLKKYPKIDILINNAGILIMHAIDEIKDHEWNRVIEVNLTGPMKMMRLVVPLMKKQEAGNIINVSSVAGIISKPFQSSYSASKAGLIGLTRASALDLAPFNIMVNALCPGTTQTEMVENVLNEPQKEAILSKVPMRRFADTSEIANCAIYLCSEYNTFMTGQSVILDGGFTVQ